MSGLPGLPVVPGLLGLPGRPVLLGPCEAGASRFGILVVTFQIVVNCRLILICRGHDVSVVVFAIICQAFRLLVFGSMLSLTAPARCCGTAKSGQRCSITSSSNMRDSLGRLVADPLRRGNPFCMRHTVLFRIEPAHIRDCIVVYMDLETSSLDVLS